MIDVKRDKAKTWPLGPSEPEDKSVVRRTDGMIREAEEMIINEVRMPATSILISTAFLPRPPKKIQHPRI